MPMMTMRIANTIKSSNNVKPDFFESNDATRFMAAVSFN